MLIQTSAPRPFFDASKNPEYLYVHTLCKPGVSDGSCFFAGPTDPEHGHHGTIELEPFQTWPIEGESGFVANEYIIPFWRVFQKDPAKEVMYTDEMGERRSAASQGIKSGSIKLTRYCTAGFGVTARSAFRASPRNYEEHTVAFRIIMPVTGGGIMRLADCYVDICNPTFDPWAADPRKQLTAGGNYSAEQIAYNRAHRMVGGSESLRAKRLASFKDGSAIQFEETPENKGLPPGVTRVPRKLRS